MLWLSVHHKRAKTFRIDKLGLVAIYQIASEIQSHSFEYFSFGFQVESNDNTNMWEILSCYKIFMQIHPDYSFNSCLAINLYNYFVNVITRLYNFYLYFYCLNVQIMAKKQYITLKLLRQFVEFLHFFLCFF